MNAMKSNQILRMKGFSFLRTGDRDSYAKRNILYIIFIPLLLPILICCGNHEGPKNSNKNKSFDLELVKSFGSENEDNESPYFFASILNVCANSKYVYVSDWKDYSIKVFDHDFKFVRKIGKKGNGPGEFGQIFAHMGCTDEKLVLLGINRLYIFSKEGDFQKEITLRFIPRRVYIKESGYIFLLNSSEYSFISTDNECNIQFSFYESNVLNSKECGKTFCTPNAFASRDGSLYVMSSLEYNVGMVDPKTKTFVSHIKRNIDFLAISCTKKTNNSYSINGGYSWMVEASDTFYYFYQDIKQQWHMDILIQDQNHRLSLSSSGKFASEMHPKCIIPNTDKIICTVPDSSHVLHVCRLKTQT